MLYMFRKNTRKFLLAIAKIISRIPFITPNRLTVLALPFAFLAAYSIHSGNMVFAVLFTALAFAVDALDGSLAEIRNQKTLFGNYLDAMVDRVVEASIFSGFLFHFPVPAFLALFSSFFSSYAKARLGLVIPADNADWPSLGDRPDRLVILFAGMVISVFFPFIVGARTMELILYLIILVAFLGSLQRVFYVRKLLSKQMGEK